MASQRSAWIRFPKFRSWQRCSRLVKEQRTRLYIIWRCTVILLSWDDNHAKEQKNRAVAETVPRLQY
ncbi:conserved hypothetical protein [Ricinus communis]|uniref:Uncharacterized protein n=1 Tax=Ricinus communis TaxID=3988 RepID=B9RSR6_RICCO|nr:conserved hypothetical protein [Ricinus communis]